MVVSIAAAVGGGKDALRCYCFFGGMIPSL
jgi:hypothetical protein